MSVADEAADGAVIRILVADGQVFQRRLLAETLRGRHTLVDHAASTDECAATLAILQLDILIVDWDLEGGGGVEFSWRLRHGEFGQHARKLPVIMVAPPRSARQIEQARNAGVDEFLIRPFTTGAMLERVAEVRFHRREFIDSPIYIGPCRRRRAPDAGYAGPRRRLFDGLEAQADAPELKIRKGLARAYCERIGVLMQSIKQDALDALREINLACGQLSAVAVDTKDPELISASASLFSYVKGVGATAALNPSVVQAHLDAVVKLAELPNCQIDIRQAVTRELGVLVAKKLKQAGQAA